MWGSWVKKEWKDKVMTQVLNHPEHIFQFLTKNPNGYNGVKMYKNCWLGTTIDTVKRLKSVIDSTFCTKKGGVKFISFEPLLEEINVDFNILINIDWIIIGANSNKNAKPAKKEWADKLIIEARKHNIAIWIKDNYNYSKIIKEFPEVKNE